MSLLKLKLKLIKEIETSAFSCLNCWEKATMFVEKLVGIVHQLKQKKFSSEDCKK